jgi:hypothetical protein
MTDRIPAFEGHPVDGTAVKMSGAAPLDDLDGEVISVDDVVQMISQFRCVGVHHQVDKNTGKLIRVQVLRPVLMALVPIDPNDPNDTGIRRSMPKSVLGSVESSREDQS